MLLAGLAESKTPVSPAEREELATLLSAIGQPDAAITALSGSAADSPGLPQDRGTRLPAPTPEPPAPGRPPSELGA
jgi:hypothetical protein